MPPRGYDTDGEVSEKNGVRDGSRNVFLLGDVNFAKIRSVDSDISNEFESTLRLSNPPFDTFDSIDRHRRCVHLVELRNTSIRFAIDRDVLLSLLLCVIDRSNTFANANISDAQ